MLNDLVLFQTDTVTASSASAHPRIKNLLAIVTPVPQVVPLGCRASRFSVFHEYARLRGNRG